MHYMRKDVTGWCTVERCFRSEVITREKLRRTTVENSLDRKRKRNKKFFEFNNVTDVAFSFCELKTNECLYSSSRNNERYYLRKIILVDSKKASEKRRIEFLESGIGNERGGSEFLNACMWK